MPTHAHLRKREKRVALYLRVSTGEQTTKNQRRELDAAAERHGWKVGAVFEDAGISGAKGRKDRPGLDAMLKAVARREVDLMMAWSVDRLGRSLVDLLATLQELHAKEVDLHLHHIRSRVCSVTRRLSVSVRSCLSAILERAASQGRYP